MRKEPIFGVGDQRFNNVSMESGRPQTVVRPRMGLNERREFCTSVDVVRKGLLSSDSKEVVNGAEV
jgi:hypothetical protein